MKNILIFGLGVSGQGVLNFCKERGINFAVYDDNASKCVGNLDDLSIFDLVVSSPGVPKDHQLLLKIKEAGLKIISDLELFKHFVKPSVKIIGITGSNGKSTTASLIYHILKKAGKNVFLGGNIGNTPLVKEAFEAEFCVFEVSSFQLEITDFVFDASAILNISNNHSASHGGMENYKKIKEKILKGEGFRVSPNDISITQVLHKGYSAFKNQLYINGLAVSNLPNFPNLNGEHNLKNILVAIAICGEFARIKFNDISSYIQSFCGLSHRIEFVREIEGIKFINDSKSTSFDATLSALKTFDKNNIFLIAGGKAKEEGIEKLLHLPEFKCVKEVFLIGTSGGIFAKHIVEYNRINSMDPIKYSICGTLEKSTLKAFQSAKKFKKSIVLLSPIASSFDQFKNFEERGNEFKKIINKL